MKSDDKFKIANKGLIYRRLNKDDQNTPIYLIRWVSIVLVSCMIFTVTIPQSTRAEDNLQTVKEMIEKNHAHLKSFFSHKQA